MPNTREKEKLIKLIERAKHSWSLSTMIPFDCTFESWIADHLIANGVTVPKWIPVTERLPEDSVAVNLHTRSGVVGTGFYDKQTKSWVQCYSGGSLFVDVTHWMPMPQPPKGE